jgi:hypothetical protein
MKASTSQVQEVNRKLQDGLQTHLLGARPITIAGKAYKPADLVKLLQAEIDAANAANAARLAWIAATKSSKQLQRDVAPIKRMLRAYIVTTFGESSAALADFGMSPRKPRKKLTVDEKVQAVDKLRATRAARRTMGKRQKREGVAHAAAPTVEPTTSIATPSAPAAAAVPMNGSSPHGGG